MTPSAWLWTRRGVQLACLALLLWSFRRTAAPAEAGYHALAGAEWWFRLDPLAQSAAALAGGGLAEAAWPALAALVLALVAGRAFCGWICPLGTLLDLWGRATAWPRRLLTRRRIAPAWAVRVRFAVLLAVLLAAAAGLQLAGLVDPFALLVRGAAAADPLLRQGADAASAAALGTAAEPASERVYQALLPWLSPRPGAPALWGAVLALLGAAFILELLGRRGWCRWACPLGALYGLLARWAPVLRLPARACTGCGGCRSACHLGAFAADGTLRRADCTLCLACLAACPRGVATVAWRPPRPSLAPPDPGRRAVLIAGVAGAALPVLGGWPSAPPAAQRPDDLLRPPGADEAAFLARCIRCGACLAACPEGALHADGFSAGLPGLLAPALVPRRGACAPDCTRCGEVCPTGAIPRLSAADKVRRPIGLAAVDRARCIPWVSAETCLVCEEHCPVADKAIRTEPGPDGADAPLVEADRCTGCGWCELVCPLEGASAIRVLRRDAPTALAAAGG